MFAIFAITCHLTSAHTGEKEGCTEGGGGLLLRGSGGTPPSVVSGGGLVQVRRSRGRRGDCRVRPVHTATKVCSAVEMDALAMKEVVFT